MKEHDKEQGIERELRLTKEEEHFLIESELSLSKAPCFDGLALRRLGLTERECELVQVFFLKARHTGFSPWRFSSSECVRHLVSCLEFLPTSATPTTEEVVCRHATDFHKVFSEAVKCGLREKTQPLLLNILGKVAEWLAVKYPLAETSFEAAGELATGNAATRKQKKLIARLSRHAGIELEDRPGSLSRTEASQRIKELLARVKQDRRDNDGDPGVHEGNVGVLGTHRSMA